FVHQAVAVDDRVIRKDLRKTQPKVDERGAGNLDGAAVKVIENILVASAALSQLVPPIVVDIDDHSSAVLARPLDVLFQAFKVGRVELAEGRLLNALPANRYAQQRQPLLGKVSERRFAVEGVV